MEVTHRQDSPRWNFIFYSLLSTVLFVIFLAMGLSISPELAGDPLDELKQLLEPLASLGPFALLFIIFFNNAIKALLAIVLGIILGLPPIIFVCMNGYTIGVVVSALGSDAGYGTVVASLLPHGIVEIPILILSTSLGIAVGIESLKYLIRQKSMVRAQLCHGLKVYLKWILAALFVAAIIEIFITPQIIALVAGEDILAH